MAYTLTVSNSQMKKAYLTFCTSWIDNLTSTDGPLEARHSELLRDSLENLLQEVGKKSVSAAVNKSPKKKSPKKVTTPKGPTKRDLKVKELQAELNATYGIESTTETVSELRKEIAAAKKAQKSVAKAKKVASSPKSPGKRDLKVKELQAELNTTYGIVSTTAAVSELRKEIVAAKKALKIAAKAAKEATKAAKVASKPKKAATPNSTPASKRQLKKVQLFAELKALGGDLPSDKPISDYTISEIRLAIKAVTPKKKGKKAKSTKKPILKKSQKDLIAELVGAPVADELENEVVNAIESPDATDNLELQAEEMEDDELVIEDSSDDEEDDEAEFPGMERVEEFEHESRPGETLYKDEDGNIWNDEQDLVGSYDEGEDCIIEE